MDAKLLENLRKEALDIRIKAIETVSNFGSGHIGGSMSIVETLTYLYYHEMNIRPEDPDWK